MKVILSIFALARLLFLPSIAQAESRDWSNRPGKIIQADLVSHDREKKDAPPKLANCSEAMASTDTLSGTDQERLSKRQQLIEEREKRSQATVCRIANAPRLRWIRI